MKKQLLAAALAAAAGVGLRFLELTRGFDANGLPSGETAYVPFVLAALCLLLLLFSRALPPQDAVTADFDEIFAFVSPLSVLLAVLGAFLLIGAAALTVLEQGVAPVSILSAVFLALCGAAAIYAVFCLRSGAAFSPVALLVPVCYLLVRLILVYRSNSKDPFLMDYYPAILACAMLCLAFLLLAAFAYRNGAPRRFSAAASLGVLFALMYGLDGILTRSFSSAACFIGLALILFAFMSAAEFEP